VGANKHKRLATSGNVQPALLQVSGTSGGARLRLAAGWR
jgi:hypothetical protein